VAVTELCRKHGVSSPTFYKWKAKFGSIHEMLFDVLDTGSRRRTPRRRMAP
jgi:transposase-like protein